MRVRPLNFIFARDHRINNHDGYEHPVFLGKRACAVETRKILQGRKVIALYVGLFLEFALTVSLLSA